MLATTISEEHRIQCMNAASFFELADVAISQLKRDFPNGAYLVSGPITSGGLFDRFESVDIVGNISIVRETTNKLRRQEIDVWDQTLYFPRLYELRVLWEAQDYKSHPHEYCAPMRDDFHARIATSDPIVGGYFIDGWQSSNGSRRVCELLNQRKKEVIHLPRGYHRTPAPLE